jgi:hypothetical protein
VSNLHEQLVATGYKESTQPQVRDARRSTPSAALIAPVAIATQGEFDVR